jgi:hypothetical protein
VDVRRIPGSAAALFFWDGTDNLSLANAQRTDATPPLGSLIAIQARPSRVGVGLGLSAVVWAA